MINFFVDPGLLLAKGDACLFIPLLGLVKAEKFARFWESVIGDNSEFSLNRLFWVEQLSLSLLFLVIVKSFSGLCCSGRLRWLAFESGIHLSLGLLWPKEPELSTEQ
jgi:hypothetical protein